MNKKLFFFVFSISILLIIGLNPIDAKTVSIDNATDGNDIENFFQNGGSINGQTLASGDTVHFKSGNYKVSSIRLNISEVTITSEKNVNIVGDNQKTTLVLDTGAKNTKISGLSITNNWVNIGIYSSGNTISNCNFKGNYDSNSIYGLVYVSRSSNNKITNNVITVKGKFAAGILLRYQCESNNIGGNTIESSNWFAILGLSLGNSNIHNNTIRNSYSGIGLGGSSNYNKIYSNDIHTRGYTSLSVYEYSQLVMSAYGGEGINIQGYFFTNPPNYSRYNLVYNNKINSNRYAVYMGNYANSNNITGNVLAYSHDIYGLGANKVSNNINGTANTPKPGSTVAVTTKLADLKITKITKKANIRYVFVKNIGKASAGKNTLGVYIGKTLIKKVSVKPIGIGKTLRVTVSIPKKYMTKKNKDKVKIFKVDIRNVVKESNKKNNSFKAK